MDNIQYRNNPIIDLNKLQHISYSQLICMQNHAEWFFLHDKAIYSCTSSQIASTHCIQNPESEINQRKSCALNSQVLFTTITYFVVCLEFSRKSQWY